MLFGSKFNNWLRLRYAPGKFFLVAALFASINSCCAEAEAEADAEEAEEKEKQLASADAPQVSAVSDEQLLEELRRRAEAKQVN